MRLIDRILSEENIKVALKAVKQNKGAAGIDKMPVQELEQCFYENGREICDEIRAKKHKPLLVRGVYIPNPKTERGRDLA